MYYCVAFTLCHNFFYLHRFLYTLVAALYIPAYHVSIEARNKTPVTRNVLMRRSRLTDCRYDGSAHTAAYPPKATHQTNNKLPMKIDRLLPFNVRVCFQERRGSHQLKLNRVNQFKLNVCSFTFSVSSLRFIVFNEIGWVFSRSHDLSLSPSAICFVYSSCSF